MIQIAVVLLLTHFTDSVTHNSEGKHFVLGFPPCASNDVILSITGKANTGVDITFRGVLTSHVIESDGTLDLNFNSSVRCENTTAIQNNGMEVDAEWQILLHVFSGGSPRSAYMAFPVEKLSSKYFLASVDIFRNGDTNRWTVVALEQNTHVTVNLKGTCTDSLTFILNQNDVIGGSCGYDFTGSDVISDKTIAVFYSTECSGPPCHHIEEMVLPVERYGKHYILSNAIYGLNTSYKMIAAELGTTLSYSYGVNTSIEAGDVVVVNSAVIGQICLVANKPILVVAVDQEGTSLSNVQPVERFLNKYSFKMTGNLIQGQPHLEVTLTFHEAYLDEIPIAYKETMSTIGCCKYMTATSSFDQMFNLHLGFPFGAQFHSGNSSHATASLVDIHFGSTTCPPSAHYSSETNLCVHSYLEEAGLSWTGSRDFCGQRGQHLLQLDTQAKNEFLIAFLANLFASVFIGANDMDADDVLTWQNGDAITYTNWVDGTNAISGMCVVLKRAANYKWAAITCGSIRKIMCQEDMVPLVNSTDFFYCQDIETSSTIVPSSSMWTEGSVSETIQGTSPSVWTEESVSQTLQDISSVMWTQESVGQTLQDISSVMWTQESVGQTLQDISSVMWTQESVGQTLQDISSVMWTQESVTQTIQGTISSTWTDESVSQTYPDTSTSVWHFSLSTSTSSSFDAKTTLDIETSVISQPQSSLGTTTLIDAILEISSSELSVYQDQVTDNFDQSLYTEMLDRDSLSLVFTNSIQPSLTEISLIESDEPTPTIDTSAIDGNSFVLSTYSSLDTSGHVTEVKVTPTSYYGYQTLYSTIVSSKCECQCQSAGTYSGNRELGQRLSEIKAELTIEKNSLTKQKGRFISRSDSRPSAAGIGYIGILFLVCVSCFFLFSDFLSLVKKCFERNRFSYAKPVIHMKAF